MLRTILRLVLIAMSVMALLIGLTLCGIGIWILANKNKVRGLFNLLDTSELPLLDKYKKDMENLVEKYDVISRVALSFLMIGLLVSIISGFGLFGAISKSRIFLIAYAITMGILLSAALGVTIFCGVFKDRISAKLSDRLANLQNTYFVSFIELIKKQDTINAVVTLGINFMQISLKCCGVQVIGDARNSTSWRNSERRLMKLMEEGVLLGGMAPVKDGGNVRRRRAAQGKQGDHYGNLDEYNGGNVPDWLKFDVPEKFTVPSKGSVPEELPDGFDVGEEFFNELNEAVEGIVTDVVDAVTKVFDEALTLRTPVTCCQMDNIRKLLENEFNANMMYDSLQELSCVLEEENFGVNKSTCYDAMWEYLKQFLVPVLVVASLLIATLMVAVGSAVGIILLG